MNKVEILKEICGIVPFDYKDVQYGLLKLRKTYLESLLSRLKQKECELQPFDFKTIVKLERKYNLCEKCDHNQQTKYGMYWCNAKRRIVSIDPLKGVTFEKLPNSAQEQTICVTITCNRFLPKIDG